VVNYHSNRAAAEELLGKLPGTGHSLAQCDVSRPDECLRMIEQVADRYGRLDVLVNNAAIYAEAPPLTATYEEWVENWQAHLACNVLGPACLSWCAARLMASTTSRSSDSHLVPTSPTSTNSPPPPSPAAAPDSGATGSTTNTPEHGASNSAPPAPQQVSCCQGGVIIGVSSRGAKRGEPSAVAYGASKAALNSMCQSLAQSLGGHNIAVAAVAPGFVSTDMAAPVLAGPRGDGIRAQSPFGRVGTPEEVAQVVAFLAEPESRWMSGAVIDCNGASYLH